MALLEYELPQPGIASYWQYVVVAERTIPQQIVSSPTTQDLALFNGLITQGRKSIKPVEFHISRRLYSVVKSRISLWGLHVAA